MPLLICRCNIVISCEWAVLEDCPEISAAAACGSLTVRLIHVDATTIRTARGLPSAIQCHLLWAESNYLVSTHTIEVAY